MIIQTANDYAACVKNWQGVLPCVLICFIEFLLKCQNHGAFLHTWEEKNGMKLGKNAEKNISVDKASSA